MIQLMIQICMKHIVSHILYDICLLCDDERPICLLQWTISLKKTMHRKFYDLSVYLMACDLLWIGRHELEDTMAIYDNMRTNELI